MRTHVLRIRETIDCESIVSVNSELTVTSSVQKDRGLPHCTVWCQGLRALRTVVRARRYLDHILSCLC